MKACPTCAATYLRQNFKIINEIGRGGMGVVYRAWHLYLNEERALKVLAGEGGTQQGIKGLVAEAQVMRKNTNPFGYMPSVLWKL